MNPKLFQITSNIVLATLLTSCLFLISCGNGNGEDTETTVTDESSPVEIYAVEQMPLSRFLDYSGIFEAGSDVTVSAETGGTIADVAVDEGDEVTKGNVVLKIDDTTARLNHSAALAQLASAESSLAIAEDPMREGQIAQLESALAAAQSQFETAESGFERAQHLFNEGAIAESELEAAQAGYDGAKAGRDSAREILDLAIEGSREEEIAAARGAVNAARARAALAADTLSKTGIKSPIDGVITDIFFELGELVGTGVPVFRILNADSMTINIGVGDREIPHISEIMPVDIMIDAFPLETFDGVVTTVGIVSDPLTGTFPVEISVTNETGEINAGMIARVSMLVGEITDGIVVPVSAILTSNEKSVVLIESGGSVEEREVEVGLYVDDLASIINGLVTGDRLVVRGQHYLQVGDPVRVVSEWDSVEN